MPQKAPLALPMLVLAGVLLCGAAVSARAEERVERVHPAQFLEEGGRGKVVVIGASTSIGSMGLGMSNLGWFGNLLNPAANYPSCEYPLQSNVEHMFLGGIWVGGIDSEGNVLVSAGAEDTGAGSGSPKQEYGPRLAEDTFVLRSSNPLSPNFSTSALADQHFLFSFDDLNAGGGGSTEDPHVPLGVRVNAQALAYSPQYADDFVILLFEVENISGREISDLYIGWYNELTVANAAKTPYGAETDSWNFYDDINGHIERGELPDDPLARMMYCYDDDGEEGAAESWIAVRLLGHDVVDSNETYSYRQWRFGQVPRFDEDKYGFLQSGRIDDGVIDGTNYNLVGNWVSLMSIGPWPVFFPGDKAHMAIAFVAGADSTEMVQNSQVAQSTYDNGFALPSGPPSPLLDVSAENNRVVLRWKPGEDPGDGEYDAGLASPEYHRSSFTNDYDFQGYRIYRLQGADIGGDPFVVSSLVAEYDRVFWPDGSLDDEGYNRGLPDLDEDGYRVFVDEGVLNGFPYWYSVTSYAARDPRLGLPELESGFYENATFVKPGSPVPGADSGAGLNVGVYPNPYRAAGIFDDRFSSGEPRELGRTIYFTNVPARARISIYNVAGTLVDRLERDDATTGQVAWDMLSENTRALAPGLYVYAVEDLDRGDVQRGKLVILK